MQKLFIKNRKGQKIALVLEQPEGQARGGLGFILHGHCSVKEVSRVRVMAEVFVDNDIIAVSFDATNSIGESDGQPEKGTATGYYEDLEDVIKWASNQAWYQEPFHLAGASLGGLCVLLYAESFPNKVKALAPIVTSISGELTMETYEQQGSLSDWKNSGWRSGTSNSRPGLIFKVPWSYMLDVLKYNVLIQTDKLTMPVLMVVGDQDESTPISHQKILFDRLPGKKEIHIIKDAVHSPWNEAQLNEFKQIFDQWIKKLDK